MRGGAGVKGCYLYGGGIHGVRARGTNHGEIPGGFLLRDRRMQGGKRVMLTAGPGLPARGGARERLSCGAGHWRAGWARGERCAGEAGEAGGLRGRATRAGVRESACWAWRGKRRERAGPKRELLGRRVGEREGRGPPRRGFGLGLGLLFWVWLGLFSITSSISFRIQTNSTKSI